MTETREQKAQRLVDQGCIELSCHSSLYTEASVRGDHSLYNTCVLANGYFYCDCEWSRYHSHTDDLCVHALAVKLTVEADDEAERAHTETLLNALDET